ncbi:MAG: prolipoprotein diacylglyceryl transferase [Bacteroidota bacterium]
MSLLTFTPIHWDIDPFVLPSFEFLRWYGLCWTLGIFVAYGIMRYIFQKEDRNVELLDPLAIYLLVGIIIGARLVHVLFYDFAYFSEHPIEILPIRLEPSFQFTGFLGLASHGGVIGALLGLYLFNRKYKEGYWFLLDRLTVAATPLAAFIRLGNLMNSEIIGHPTSVPWAFVFSRVDDLPRHPAQLYEAIFYLGAFALLFYLWRKPTYRSRPGWLFSLGLFLVFAQRFFVEFFKVDQAAVDGEWLLNTGQLLSIPMIVLGGIGLWYASRAKEPSSESPV